MMYSQEQIQDAMKQEQEKHKQYDENSIDKARTKWQDARETLQKLQSSGNSELILAARQAEAEAKTELDDATKYSSHLVEAKRLRDLQSAREAEQKKAQQEEAAQEKSAYLAQLKEKWLATGGSEHGYQENKEAMWDEEVKRRVTSYQSPVEQDVARLRASGAYGSI